MTESFGGASKVGTSMLHKLEQWLIHRMAPRVPSWIHSHHLTLATIPISGLIILGGYLARENAQWLWMNSALIVLHWCTDSLDGAVGRLRREGLVRWGYYMDHFLDYIFLASILISYTLFLQQQHIYAQFFILVIFAAFMVNAYLGVAATNEFRVSYSKIGPTEVRIGFIAVNLLYIFFGRTFLAGIIPYVLAASFLILCIVVLRTSRRIWKIDMEAKRTGRNM